MNTIYKLKQKGISMMELIVVLIITAILAAIGVAKYQDVSSEAGDAVAISTSQNASSAITSYQAGHGGKYPKISDLAPLLQTPGSPTQTQAIDGKIYITGESGNVYSITLNADAASDKCDGTIADGAANASYACSIKEIKADTVPVVTP